VNSTGLMLIVVCIAFALAFGAFTIGKTADDEWD
jgi:hypothetical protein